MNTTTLRDPTAEAASVARARRMPPATLDGSTIGLMDIGKMRGDEFIDRLEQLFVADGRKVRRYRKPTNTRTAPVEMLQAIAAECDVVVIALSDCGSCTSCSTHDLNDLDQRGIPGVSVLTGEFRDAFAKQCGAIGFGGASVYVPHPMQNRTTTELHGLADDCFAEILARIAAQGAQS
jgi:RNase P protein component